MATGHASTSAAALNAEDPNACIHRIHAALAPRIAILSSADVDDALRPNKLDSFSELVRPFEELIENVSVRTSQLETRQCHTFPLTFAPLEEFAPSNASAASSDANLFTPADLVQSQTDAAEPSDGSAKSAVPDLKLKRRSAIARPEVLLDAISARISSKSKALWEARAEEGEAGSGGGGAMRAGHHRRKSSSYPSDAKLAFADDEDVHVEKYRQTAIDSLTPWFSDTRDMVLQTRQVSDHETFGHPIAIVIVVSASSPDPLNALANLFEASQSHVSAAFSKRPFVDPLVFRYYVVLHDVAASGSDLSDSVALLENVKKTYGLHCCLLPINSAGSTSSDGRTSVRSDNVSDLWARSLQSSRDSARTSNNSASSTPARRRPNASIDGWHNEDELEEKKYASMIDDDDVRRIRAFVRDFAAQSLVPFMERCVSLWTEQLAASRKGLTGRLLGAGRKFFGGASRGAGSGQNPASFAQLGYYPHTTIEAQTRRLADFAFVTRDYKLAASMYDLGRRDYANDKAHKYIAGANEMFGLSHLMIMLGANTTPIDVDSYLAAAGANYLLAPRQKGSSLQLNSLRATLLYYEAYRALSFYRPAPQALVRTANEGSSEEENDLEVVAAMLLEQAALADLRQTGKPALRKCALHLVMAAHRYRSCGQKHLSLRCFQASAMFYRKLRHASLSHNPSLDPNEEGDGEESERILDFAAKYENLPSQEWNLINDHMDQEMAQQAFNDGRIAQATVHYASILQRQVANEEVWQSASSHEEYLRGFLTCCKYLDEDVSNVLAEHDMQASLRIVDQQNTFVEVNVSMQNDDLPWRKLEERVLGESVSSAYKSRNTAAVGETFSIAIGLRNPLKTTLSINTLSVELIDGKSNEVVNDESIKMEEIGAFALEPLETRRISMRLSSTVARTLRCAAVRYNLSGEVRMREGIEKRGKRLNDTKEQRSSQKAVYASNESISVVVHESKAIVEADFVDAPSQLGLGEERTVHVRLANAGKAAVFDLVAHVSRPDTLLPESDEFTITSQMALEVENTLQAPPPFLIPLPKGDRLEPGESFTIPLVLRGSALGRLSIRALIVFTSTRTKETLTSQLQHDFYVEPVIDLAVQAVPARTITDEIRYHLRLDALSLLDGETSQTNVEIFKLSFVAPSWVVAESQDSHAILKTFKTLGHQHRRSAEIFLSSCESTNDEKSGESRIIDLRFTVEKLRSMLTGRGLEEAKTRAPMTSLQFSELQGVHDGPRSNVSRFLLSARRQFRLTMLGAEFPSLVVAPKSGVGGGGNTASRRPEQQLERIFTLYEPRDVDIVAHWRIAEEGVPYEQQRQGQAFIFGLALGPLHDYLSPLFNDDASDPSAAAAASKTTTTTRTMYAQTEREKTAIWNELRASRLHVDEDPIMLEFDVPRSVQKDVALLNEQRQVIDVAFVIRNLSSLHSFSVILQLDNTSPPAGNAAGAIASASHPASPPVYASYIDRLTLRAIVGPLARTVLYARASIAKPGQVHLAPVLVRSKKQVSDNGKPVEFHRWEYCSQTVQVE